MVTALWVVWLLALVITNIVASICQCILCARHCSNPVYMLTQSTQQPYRGALWQFLLYMCDRATCWGSQGPGVAEQVGSLAAVTMLQITTLNGLCTHPACHVVFLVHGILSLCFTAALCDRPPLLPLIRAHAVWWVSLPPATPDWSSYRMYTVPSSHNPSSMVALPGSDATS